MFICIVLTQILKFRRLLLGPSVIYFLIFAKIETSENEASKMAVQQKNINLKKNNNIHMF